jgi:hypothetical protein
VRPLTSIQAESVSGRWNGYIEVARTIDGSINIHKPVLGREVMGRRMRE